MPFDPIAGEVLLVDKPLGWTSFDVVGKIRGVIRYEYGIKKIKVGHCGTLDPLATGLLIICTGKKTKTIDGYQGLEKTYSGTVKFGATTPGYDAEMEEDAQFPFEHINPELIEEKLVEYRGEIMQSPPAFSALKVDGKPLYKKARTGEKIEVPKRKVTIHKFEQTAYEAPFMNFEVICSKGTYIRSLANDLGKSLQSGGYLTALRRDAIGEHLVTNAWKMDDLIPFIREKGKEFTQNSTNHS